MNDGVVRNSGNSSGNTFFVYGTLMFTSVYQGVTGVVPEFEEGFVRGFSRFAVHDTCGARYPAIISDPAGTVFGKVVFGVTDVAVAALDRFEEVSSGLFSRHVTMAEFHGGTIEAQVYVASEELRTSLKGGWDPTYFEQHHLQDFLHDVVAQFRIEEQQRDS